jgi:hypothetical protein
VRGAEDGSCARGAEEDENSGEWERPVPRERDSTPQPAHLDPATRRAIDLVTVDNDIPGTCTEDIQSDICASP